MMDQKFAKVPDQFQKQGITWLRLSPSRGKDEGTFLLLYTNISQSCKYDDWFFNADEALKFAETNYGVKFQDWITIEEIRRMGIEVVDEY